MSETPNVPGFYDLKDESQVKEYLDNVSTEYRFQCYQENSPDGCHRLADFLEAFRKETPKARTIYMTNCNENKYGHSCFKAGNYHLLGRGGENNVDKALEFFIKGCEYQYDSNCHNAALLYSSGKVGEGKDYVKAGEFLKKGCAQGNAASCQEMSTYHLLPRPGFQKDMTKAFEYAKKACDLGHMYGCVNLSIMYKKGDGTEKNLELAKKMEKKAKSIHKKATDAGPGIEFGLTK